MYVFTGLMGLPRGQQVRGSVGFQESLGIVPLTEAACGSLGAQEATPRVLRVHRAAAGQAEEAKSCGQAMLLANTTNVIMIIILTITVIMITIIMKMVIIIMIMIRYE